MASLLPSSSSSSSSVSVSPTSWSKLFIAVGTYDGALAGWELKNDQNEATTTSRKTTTTTKGDNKLTLTFATACHDGSVRSLCFASPIPSTTCSIHHDEEDLAGTATTTLPSSSSSILPGALLSCGFDELLRTHDWSKRKTGLGEVRTPTDFGTPLCASFAPPPPLPLLASTTTTTTTTTSTHALVGFSQGKIVIYKKRDWSVQHVLAGHDGGVSSLAVHPSGKLALSGGQSDGKLKLWDLTKGRLAYATQVVVTPAAGSGGITKALAQKRRSIMPAVHSLVWSPDGTAYGFCHGTHITVRHVDTGKDLLDVDDLPSRVNQVALLSVPEGLFVAAACDDGSLPVLAVQLANNVNNNDDDDNNDGAVRRAIMAIEPVDATVAGEERFKCIQLVSDYHVVTANSAGVVSLMSLKGAIQMILKPQDDDDEDEEEEEKATSDNDSSGDEQERNDKGDDNDDEEELAVEILDSVQLGQGSRITCLSVWAQPTETLQTQEETLKSLPTVEEEDEDEQVSPKGKKKKNNKKAAKAAAAAEEEALGDKRRRPNSSSSVDMDSATIKKARELVTQAKELQKKRDRKRRKTQNKNK